MCTITQEHRDVNLVLCMCFILCAFMWHVSQSLFLFAFSISHLEIGIGLTGFGVGISLPRHCTLLR